ncbi:lipopolysaccharide-responsive and beige-like anchor protein isoform X3 [Onychomys torridus]|uniref:lipopolysaccharide-responsive and beige-like anchor protein isoform X3 n=1 Tax=Onychomys torridus TaxID=38674 RepID=UPI00167F89E2|nr:lipopolysaccharide-responsive and beige-like anchor protein isoform X3 [Onychomys torridus]
MASEDSRALSRPPTGDDGGGAGNEEPPAEGGALSLKPGLPIRGIRMKFAVLTGLVEVGEVSNRDIVETVFNLLVGGQFDLEMNFIIQEGESIICMAELLEKCDVTCQAEVWSMFTAILKKSIRNLQVCTEVGLVEKVLGKIEKVDSMIADLLVDMLGVLASYNLTVRELKLFFSKLQGDKGQWAIALPPIARWPYQNGFTFHTWLRMDPVNNINVDKDKPYLYCFRTSKGLGYSAHFVGGCLIITSIKSKGKGFQHCVKFDFKPQKWYMVTIVHIYNRWKNSELRCYVNGELASYGEITWFVNTSDTFDKCFLGSSETADAHRVFCGQMTAVYLFSDALNAAQIFAIYQLGLGYKGTFKFKAESDLFLAEHHKLLLYDGKLSSAIAFTYNPRATDAQLCLESSPKDNPSIFVHSPHALMLQDVKAVLTHSIQSAMHSIGGVQVLFPLFAQLDYRQYLSDEVDLTICTTLLAFIMELLKNSIAMQEQMLACKGFLVIGYSLEKSSKSHVSRAVLELCLAFSKYLSSLQNGMPLLKQLCDHVLLNPAIWIHTPAKVQLMLYTYLSTEFIGTVNIYNTIRRVGTVLLIMHTLKYYYWAVNPQDRSGITPKGLDGPRPNQKEILSLRAFLLMFIKQLVMKDSGVKEDELQAILNYLLTMHEDDNLMDVLQLLVALMAEHPNSMIPAFDQRNGLRVIYKLLASKSEGIRVQALKALGYFLKHLAPKRKAEVMLGHGLFSLLAERLLLQTNLITMTTYNVLFEILIEQICTQVVHKQHPDPDSTVKIQNPQILKVIATLLRNSPQCPESMEVRRAFLSDMIKLFNNSRENRRSLLQCSVWQEWMLSLCYFNPKNSDEQKITEMVYAIFRILLYHAVKYEWGGWRVWVDTLSITHSKVTFEIHKENLANIFKEQQGKGDEGLGPCSSSLVPEVTGVTRDVDVSVGPQHSDLKDSSNSPHFTRNSDENSSIGKASSVDSASNSELQTPDPSNDEKKMEQENQELLDQAAVEGTATNETRNPCDLEASSDVVDSVVALVSDSFELPGKDTVIISEISASISSPSEQDAAEVPELLEKSGVEEEEDDDYVELKVESSPTEEASLPTELQDNSLSVAASEAREGQDMCGNDCEVQEEISNTKIQDDTDTGDSKDSRFPTVATPGPLATSPDAPVSQTTVQSDIDETLDEGMKATNAGETELVSDCADHVSEAPATFEQKIAKLDVSSVASDTERFELKASASIEAPQPHRHGLEVSREQDQPGQATAPDAVDQQRRDSRSTMFRIPEFKWSQMHQRLLTDLLFSIETDIQMWRSHSTKTVMDFVNSSDNVIFVHNTVHLISQVMDNMVMACGGILPLLSAATSATHELENIEPTQGLSIETSVTFLQRLISLVDVLIFASSLGFTEIEAEKNMSSGGILRQCLRLVCAVAVRTCLECQQRSQLTARGEPAKGLTPMGRSAAKSPMDIVTGGISPVRDLERLLQDMDINRLRAVVFRDIEDSKQAQFLALAVVYFISVLMVSKYRDILEPQDERHSQSLKETGSENGNASLPDAENTPADFSQVTLSSVEESVESTSSTRRKDSGLGEETASGLGSNPSVASPAAPLGVSAGPDAISEVLCTLSLEVNKSQETKIDGGNELDRKVTPSVPVSKNVNVKDILRSLVNMPADGVTVDPALLPPACLGALGDLSIDPPVQFRSFDRSVIIATKKSAVLPSTLTTSTPTNAVSVVSSVDSTQVSDVGGESPGSRSPNAKLPSVPAVGSVPQDPVAHMSITERLEHALEKAAPLLREIFVDFAPFLSRTLLGSHGQELLIEGTSLVCMKSSSSVVELVMLLCSQEWQNSIQKNAGLAFIELVNEGRLLSQTMKDHLVRVANEAEFILSRQRAEDIHRHAEFESLCAQYSADKREEEKMCDHLIRAAKYRDHVTATQFIQKVVNLLTDKHGAWGGSTVSRPREFWRLDYWEDDLRRRRRFVRNPLGSTHPEATLKTAVEHAADEDILAKGKQSIKSQALGNQNSENDALLEGDEDTLSSVDEKDLENLAGPVSLSTPAQLVAPSVVVKGTLSVTSSELYFEVDEEDPNFRKIDPKILAYTEGLHGKWLFTEIRSIFSRRYLLQNTALEIFMANRVAVMFNFPDPATVKKVVNYLPRVGVGTSFGLPQTRRISLATPRQLFKASNMTQRWQHREISNFEYLMFLNTIAGRGYNDLNQYPVFPWVITNYESEELDLTLPSNFRDLSKPIGALNPKRAAFFAERFESWEDDHVPKFHYGTHYSTASFVLAWLLRIEPFTTYFLNLQGGKFDHADRTFSSVSRAWRNSQRDTSDIKELIPEFYYLPEMFVNFNNYNLGVMDDGTVVSDVELPPWAKTSEEFVRINRLALESEFVSCQLHQWIDLIFGYKQQGPEAVRALNVFYYLTYEGAVSLNSITDPVLREAVEAQIRSFGQTPSQLLIEPHPPRGSAMQAYLLLQSPLMFTDQAQQDVIMVLKFPSNSAVTHVAANTQPGLATPAVITVTANRLFAVNKWHNLPAHQGAVQDQPYQLPVEIDPLIACGTGTHRRQVTDLLDQSIQVHSQCFVITSDNRYILICGFWDKSFRVYSTDTGKLIQVVFGHWDVVTCLTRSESYIGGNCYILSGSRDATLLLWYWNGKGNGIGDNPGSETTTPRAILTGHDYEITCAAVCAELGLVLSGSQEGPCLIHSMNGDLLRTLEGPENCLKPKLIQASREGHCVIFYDNGCFCTFSVNGKLQATMETDDHIRAIQLSRDGQYLLTGGDNGVVIVRQVSDLRQLFAYPGCDAGIRAMALSFDQRCIISGMASGSIVLFYNDFNRWHHEYQTRY